MTRKTMRNRGFEPWTFRSCLGYQHFVINDNNRDQRKKDSKKTSIATVAEIKTEANVAEKASALVVATDHGGKFLNTFTPVINSAWIIDFGAIDHMTFDSRQVSPLRPSSQKTVSTANGNTTPVIRERSLTLTDTLNLDSVLVVPSLDYNLLSVSQITAALSCIVIFLPEFCVIKDIQTRQTIGCGIKRGKLYYLDLQSKDSNKLQQALIADGSEEEKKKSEIWLWHRRLGHASFGYLKKLFPSFFAKSDISGFRCDICELAKSHCVSFPLILNKSPFPFMVIHSDVWGPSKVPTLSGSRWFVTFIDDCTRMTWLCLMKTKDEVNLLFQNFHKMIETQYNAKVRVLRSDNGGEYQSSNLQKYLEGHDIIHQTTCSNTPQQNGVDERKNRHLLEVVRASLIATKTPISYWGEAITFGAYLINRVPSSSINFQTPLQALTNVVVAPTVPNLPPRVFGCVAFVHLHKHQRTKLTSHALQCVFVGYALHKKGYRCYHPPIPSSNSTNVYYNGCGVS
ncbi:Retrovirus-related Pol polyprotein from transposon TNT 1-94 [Vitis vinifera]|uniref:Retrovirus-related Pol polyprotein from transposon TNT 1-94 n=1 Tax=Vitis vinifera TaxID=29760 RepID=A0A438G1G8_VITVI|nr:Retrovirus-related Pol polyprotein from transposon TNT 1-94 [Vitis vinifera]